MSDKIIHLIIIQADEPIGMDEILRRLEQGLRGALIEIRDVNPAPEPPTEFSKRYYMQKDGMTAWVRSGPGPTFKATGKLIQGGGYAGAPTSDGQWIYLPALGYVDASAVREDV